MIYHGAGTNCDVIMCEATEQDDGSDIIILDDEIVSPTMPVQIILSDSDRSHAKIVNAIYGCLPNQMYVIAVPNGLLELSAGQRPELPNVRIILEPYTEYDEHIVQDLILELSEDDDDGSEESEIPDHDMGRSK